jgi:sporulation protein YlmC with PRC-barrel domain
MSIVKSLVALSAGTVMLSTAAFAQQMAAGRADLMSSVPASSLTVTDWYKQPVYDKTNAKIGDINDVLVGPNGEINAVIIGVGGFLGAGEKDVAVNFSAIKKTTKDSKTYLTMDTTKDALKGASGFKYDSDKTSWVPAKQ